MLGTLLLKHFMQANKANKSWCLARETHFTFPQVLIYCRCSLCPLFWLITYFEIHGDSVSHHHISVSPLLYFKCVPWACLLHFFFFLVAFLHLPVYGQCRFGWLCDWGLWISYQDEEGCKICRFMSTKYWYEWWWVAVLHLLFWYWLAGTWIYVWSGFSVPACFSEHPAV